MDGLGKGFLGVPDQRGMEGRRNRQRHHRIAFFRQDLLNFGNGRL